MQVEEGTILKGSHTHAHTYQCGECGGGFKKIGGEEEEGVRKHKT